MEIYNKTLDTYCKYLYFLYGKPTILGQLSNFQLELVIKFLDKYPQGLLNGYNKKCYKYAVNYILKCRANSSDFSLKRIEASYANKAEIKAEKLTNFILECLINTEKQYR